MNGSQHSYGNAGKRKVLQFLIRHTSTFIDSRDRLTKDGNSGDGNAIWGNAIESMMEKTKESMCGNHNMHNLEGCGNRQDGRPRRDRKSVV